MKTVFTIATIAIIGTIAFLLVPTATVCGPSGKATVAKNDVCNIAQAVSFYINEYGTPPSGTFSEVIGILSGNNQRKIVFLDLASTHLTLVNGVPTDPWRNSYRLSNTSQKPHVWSIGKDGIDQGGLDKSDDIASWN